MSHLQRSRGQHLHAIISKHCIIFIAIKIIQYIIEKNAKHCFCVLYILKTNMTINIVITIETYYIPEIFTAFREVCRNDANNKKVVPNVIDIFLKL